MIHMKKIIVIYLTGLMLTLSSCADYLDVAPYFDEMLNLEQVFQSRKYSDQFLLNVYSYRPDEGNLLFSFPYTAGSDELCMAQFTQQGPRLSSGNYNAENNPFSIWSGLYRGIRQATVYLNNIDKCTEMTSLEIKDRKAEARFMRAYYYFLLVQHYGPVVILPNEGQTVNQALDELSLPRSTYDECVEYIVSELNIVVPDMPDVRDASWFGKPTKPAAYAIQSRLLLYAASPLFNGNREDYGSFLREDKTPFFNLTPDNMRWAKAAAAAKRVIDTNRFSLYTVKSDSTTANLPANVPSGAFPNGAGGIDPFKSYHDIFTGEVQPSLNPEAIWGIPSKQTDIDDNVQTAVMPRFIGGWNIVGVTQKMVDAYYMRDGYSMENSSTLYPYQITGYLQNDSAYVKKGVHNMFVNREARFYASISFNRRVWPCTSSKFPTVQNFVVMYSLGGNGSKDQGGTNGDFPATGYSMVKYTSDSDQKYHEGSSVKPKAYITFRYAEILLNYIESLNEIQGTHVVDGVTYTRNADEIKKYFNMIHYRAGLPGIGDAGGPDLAVLASVEATRTLIKRERMIELAFEGRRFLDVRRWKDAMVELNKPVRGLDMEKTESGGFYIEKNITVVRCDRKFQLRNYLFPLPKTDIDKNYRLIQNPGW